MAFSKFIAMPIEESGFLDAIKLVATPKLALHPRLSEFGLEYYPLTLGKNYLNKSFILLENEKPVAVAILGSDGQQFSQFGAPIKLILIEGLSDKKIRNLFRNAIAHIIKSAIGEKTIHLADRRGLVLSPLGEVCLTLECEACTRVMAYVDLTKEIKSINACIRKSYRSLINWGRTNLDLEYVNATNPSWEKFQEFQKFHKRVSGRTTRSQESWDVMYSALQQNFAELTLGYQFGELVSGALIIDGAKTSIYASGVYDRSKFDRPLAHWLLYDSIVRSKSRGKKIFEIGLVDKHSNPSQKEINIAQFKRGFATNLEPELSWLVPIKK